MYKLVKWPFLKIKNLWLLLGKALGYINTKIILSFIFIFGFGFYALFRAFFSIFKKKKALPNTAWIPSDFEVEKIEDLKVEY